jgi:hypothetical protein
VRFVRVARGSPVVEVVGIGRSLHVVGHLVRPGNFRAVTRIHRERLPAASCFGLSRADHHEAKAPIWIYPESIHSVAQQRHGRICRVDFEDLVGAQIVYAELHVAFGQLDLHGLIVQIQKPEARIRSHPHGGLVEV